MAKRKWPRVAVATLILLLAGSLVFAVFNQRRLRGAIPGEQPILGLGVTTKGYIVGTGKGAFRSDDGETWEQVDELERLRTLVTSVTGTAFVSSDRLLLKTTDLKDFGNAFGGLLAAVAIGADAEGNLYVAETAKRMNVVTDEGGLDSITTRNGPDEVVAFAGSPGEPATLLAGGLRSGLWRSTDGGLKWRHILLTPTRAIVIDPTNNRRILIGTAGGILVSADQGSKWRQTEMRTSIEALAAFDGKFYAVTQDRLLFSSPDGVKGWERVIPQPD